jgi:tetratricopeptide (TPR) repeat protein
MEGIRRESGHGVTNSGKIIVGAAIAAVVSVSVCGIAGFLGYRFFDVTQAKKLLNDGYAAVGRGEYDTGIGRFSAALQRGLTKSDRAYAFQNRAFCEDKKEQREDAMRDYTEALKLNPELAFSYDARGTLYEAKAEPAKAFDDYSKAITIDPNLYHALFRRGLIQFARKNWKGAVADFSEAIRTWPASAEGYFNRGLSHFNSNNFEHALADFDAAIEISPRYYFAIVQRGYAYERKNDWEKAVANFNQAIKINPKNGTAFRARAFAYSHKGDYQAALADFREALRLTPKDPWTLNNAAWFFATCADQSFRNGREAVIEATEACQMSHWKESIMIDTLAAACGEVGDFDHAVEIERLALAGQDISKQRIPLMQRRLDLFLSHRPYREENMVAKH